MQEDHPLPAGYHDRRLCDRIMHALDLALEQKELEASELLWRSLEIVLTRFGGPGAVEKRDPPSDFDSLQARLQALRGGVGARAVSAHSGA
jgi:hypothetical protein